MWDALRSCTGACNLALTAAFTAAGCGGRCRGSGVLEGQGAHGPQAVVAHISEVEVAIEQQGVHLQETAEATAPLNGSREASLIVHRNSSSFLH
eukprot:scaffold155755_cov17-Tisochrysis_lutea.AAC.1